MLGSAGVSETHCSQVTDLTQPVHRHSHTGRSQMLHSGSMAVVAAAAGLKRRARNKMTKKRFCMVWLPATWCLRT
jgi:citrate lyase alpha subunit